MSDPSAFPLSLLSTRPRRWAAAVVLLAVMAAGVAYGLHTLPQVTKGRIGATRTQVPGSVETDLDAGKYVIYYEPYLGVSPFSAPRDLHVSVTPVSGRPLPLGSYFGSGYVGSTGSQGRAIATVQVPHAGLYVIAAGGADASLLSAGATVVLGVSTGWATIRMAVAFVIALLAFIALCNLFSGRLLSSLVASRYRRMAWVPPAGSVGVGGPAGARVITFGPDGPVVVPGSAANGQLAEPSLADRLTQLAALHERGILSDEAFETQKQRMLAAATTQP